MENIRDSSTLPTVFKLSEMVNLYRTRMGKLGFPLSRTQVHSTRLENDLLARFPDLKAHHTFEQQVLLAFDETLSNVLGSFLDRSNREAVQLAEAAKTLRRHINESRYKFTGFTEGCQEESVPIKLLAFVNMVLGGPDIECQNEQPSQPATLAIAQLERH